MHKLFLFLFLFFFNEIEAQQFKIDTLYGARASSSNYTPINIYGKTRAGHIYTCGFIFDDDLNKPPKPLIMARIDLTEGTVMYKEITGTVSSSSALWAYVFDQRGNFYLGLNTNNRKIFRFNLKDGIEYKNLGNGFKNSGTLAYSMALGVDGHIYFGGSSGKAYVTDYNYKTEKMIQYPVIDSANPYVLSITGDKDFIYAQTGQKNSLQFWTMKKSDSTRHLFFKIPNTTRMSLVANEDGVYLSFYCDTLHGTWKMINGIPVAVKDIHGKGMEYDEVNNPLPQAKSYFDAVQKKLFYSVNGEKYKNIEIKSGQVNVITRSVFSFDKNDMKLYFAGDYYGNYYEYNLTTNTSKVLGNTGFNIYSVLQDTDSTVYLGNYPSGALLKWNRNIPWTLAKFIDNKIVQAGKASNPRLIGFLKSQTPAGFHHLQLMKKDFKGNIICAGNVIRIGNTCSIGVYDPQKDSLYGYDFMKIKNLAVAGLAAWKNLMIFSTVNINAPAKLYFYNSITNAMVDSIETGFNDFGKINIKENILTGIANDRIYKLDLSTKKIIQNFSYPKNSIQYSQMLSNGVILIKTQNNLPAGFAKFIKLPYTYYYESGKDVYAISADKLIRLTNIIQ